MVITAELCNYHKLNREYLAGLFRNLFRVIYCIFIHTHTHVYDVVFWWEKQTMRGLNFTKKRIHRNSFRRWMTTFAINSKISNVRWPYCSDNQGACKHAHNWPGYCDFRVTKPDLGRYSSYVVISQWQGGGKNIRSLQKLWGDIESRSFCFSTFLCKVFTSHFLTFGKMFPNSFSPYSVFI